MRESCLDCARKHLAQALVLMQESRLGYPEHKWIAIGHLAEASEELVKDYQSLAGQIRCERLKYMDDSSYNIDIMHLIELIGAFEVEPEGFEEIDNEGS